MNKHLETLDQLHSLIPLIVPPHPEINRSVLWHTDLHGSNVMVENTEHPSAIADIIDWQFMMVAPLFTQARFADFLKYTGKKIAMEAGIFLPKRPEKYDLMSVTDQKVVDAELREASTHKLYKIFLEKRNTMHYVSHVYEFTGHNVMSLLSASRTWHEGLHHLREVMYQIVLVWPKIASGAALPDCVDVASLSGIPAFGRIRAKCGRIV